MQYNNEKNIYLFLINISIISMISIPIIAPIIGILGCKFIYYIIFLCLLNIAILFFNKKQCLYVYTLIIFIILQFLMFRDLNIAFLLDLILMITTIKVYSSSSNIDRLEKKLINNRRMVIIYIWIAIFIEILLYILGIGIENIWDGKYFKAFMDIPHNNSYFLLVLQIILMYYIFTDRSIKKQIYFIIPTMFLIIINLTTGARTPTGISLVLLCITMIKFIVMNKRYLHIFIPIFIIIIILGMSINNKYSIIELSQIPFVEKFTSTIEKGNITNSRGDMQDASMTYYKTTNMKNKILGSGFGFTLKINEYYFNSSIWAHNDFIDILVCGGIIGLFIYMITTISFIVKYKSLLFMIIIFTLAYWNGLYTYYILSSSLPILMLACNRIKSYG